MRRAEPLDPERAGSGLHGHHTQCCVEKGRLAGVSRGLGDWLSVAEKVDQRQILAVTVEMGQTWLLHQAWGPRAGSRHRLDFDVRAWMVGGSMGRGDDGGESWIHRGPRGNVVSRWGRGSPRSTVRTCLFTDLSTGWC